MNAAPGTKYDANRDHVVHLRICRGTNTPEASLAKGTVEEVATEITRHLATFRTLDVQHCEITRDPAGQIIRYLFEVSGFLGDGTPQTWDHIVTTPARPYERLIGDS